MSRNNQTVKLRPFFSYYGAKWRASATHYPPPAHEVIVEPFAGSAGYATRHPDRAVILCEKDPVVAELWSYLIGATSQQILQLPDIGPTETVETHHLEGPERSLVGFWLNHGSARPTLRPSKWMRAGTHPTSFWGAAIRERIASQLPAIRHWEVYRVSYEQCPFTGPATWFVDPPYVGAGVHYRHGTGGIDYAHLGKWTMALRGQVIACEGPGATWLPFTDMAPMKTARRNPAMESVWITNTEEATS